MSISISINAGKNASSSSVTATGSIQNIITNPERTLFGINDAPLKTAIAAYFGLAPNDAFVCSPTPWNDLYNTYGWPQVQTTYSVVSATILGETSVPVIINTQDFSNPSATGGTFDCEVFQDVSVTSESNWSNTTGIGVGQSISYGISFLGSGVQGETSMQFSQTWEKGGSQSESLTLGKNAGVSVFLNPGETIQAELTSNQGKLQVQIVYQVTLSGSTACNYSNPYQGHHFWALDINSVMSAGNIATSYTVTETIEVDFYSDSKIVLKNSNQEVFGVRHLGIKPGVIGTASFSSTKRAS